MIIKYIWQEDLIDRNICLADKTVNEHMQYSTQRYREVGTTWGFPDYNMESRFRGRKVAWQFPFNSV